MVPCLTLGVCVEHRAQLAPSPLHFPRVPGVAQQQHHQERRPVDCAIDSHAAHFSTTGPIRFATRLIARVVCVN